MAHHPRTILVTAVLSAVVAVTLAACGSEPAPSNRPTMESVPFREDGRLAFHRGPDELVDIAIEIADTDSTRTRGLMQREGLPDRSGMLFVFAIEQPQSFWMANTQMPLDLLFVNEDRIVVSITRSARPLSPEPVPSLAPARYVVEVEAGFVDTWGLIEGDSTSWRRTDG